MIFCDAHVHYYECFEFDRFLDNAWINFCEQYQYKEIQSELVATLMMTEAKQDHWFQKLKEKKVKSTRWSFQDTNEPESIFATDKNANRILIVNGRQIVTAENLEVLALATSEKLVDGQPITDVIKWVKAHNGIPVIPWGFGKWWGRRGNILSEVLEIFSKDEVFLGDNSGRAGFLGFPQQFKRAISEQRRILPGSDPLPFASEAWRAGSVGFYFDADIDETTPAESLRKHLRNPDTKITSYMQCERLFRFVRNQVAMQIKKRM